jgi:hypothetical protein
MSKLFPIHEGSASCGESSKWADLYKYKVRDNVDDSDNWSTMGNDNDDRNVSFAPSYSYPVIKFKEPFCDKVKRDMANASKQELTKKEEKQELINAAIEAKRIKNKRGTYYVQVDNINEWLQTNMNSCGKRIIGKSNLQKMHDLLKKLESNDIMTIIGNIFSENKKEWLSYDEDTTNYLYYFAGIHCTVLGYYVKASEFFTAVNFPLSKAMNANVEGKKNVCTQESIDFIDSMYND